MFRQALALPFCLLPFAVCLADSPPQVYKAARIWTGDGPAIANGLLIVRNGKLEAVGPRDRVTVPEDAEIHDLGSAIVIPGLVIAETTLAEGGRDDDLALTPEFRAIDGFDFYADYRRPLSGGVTTVQVAPGSRRLMPGQGAVVKLAGDDPGARTLRERESLRIVLGDAFKNPPRIYEPPVGAVSVDRPLEPTRHQLAASLASAVAGLRATLRAAKEYDPSAPRGSAKDLVLAAIADQLRERKPIRITAPSAADIRAALALAREFDLRIVLVDPAGLEVFRDQFASWHPWVEGVILNAEVRPGVVADLPVPDKDAPKRRTVWENAHDLLKAGIKLALRPVSDADLEETLFLGGLLTTGQLHDADVLRMLTVSPAEILGVADRVGALAVGKDADFVVLNGDPFAAHTRVQAVYVNGQPVYAAKGTHKATVIRAAKIYTGSGNVITNGAVLVEGTTIRGLGSGISAAADASVRQFDRAVIVPGFLDLATGLGLGGPLTTSVALDTKLGDRLVSGDPAVAVARQGGVTTVLLASTSSGATPVVALKLGDRPRVVADPIGIRFGLTGNLTSQAASLRSTLERGKSYADDWTRYEAARVDYDKKKKEYDAAKAKTAAKSGEKKSDAASKKEDGPAAPTEPKSPDKPRLNEALEPYRQLFAGKIPALVDAHRADAIQLAIQIFHDEFKLRMILLGADDAFRLADLMAEKQLAVAIGPQLVRTVDREPINLAQVLANRGVPFGFQSKATTGVKTLPLAVQYAVRCGLGADDALAALTAAPAKFLSIDKHLGTLAVGKDADLVVLSGAPFELSTRVLAVMIDGQWVYQEDEGDR
ncbi:MAG TPA: amidohydrolase family protein [Gemmataceae bacterium]|nr:amidohydrolase family protein [Gemmataceae bacterium]